MGLLYTILILFAYQGHRIISNIRPVFRVFVPLILYFLIMWIPPFLFVHRLSRGEKGANYGYKMAVVQAFTAASNNFVSHKTFLNKKGGTLNRIVVVGVGDSGRGGRVRRRLAAGVGGYYWSSRRSPRSARVDVGQFVV